MALPEPFIRDSDFTLYVGDVREVLAGLDAESVDCVVTSPPYWGLRDYGTGEWEGGDTECDHQPPKQPDRKFTNGRGEGQGDNYAGSNLKAWTDRDGSTYRDTCGKCGAHRIDRQLGLEPTPEEYVANMVEVFREIRRVLAPHGTCWVNLGDSYTSNPGSGQERGNLGGLAGANSPRYQETMRKAHSAADGRTRTGLKPKDLVGIPWRIAFALQADGWFLRSDIIWSKPNPMPESVTDRPTKAHEYVFLLSKQPRYFFDQEAVRESWKPEHLEKLGEKVTRTRNSGGRTDGFTSVAGTVGNPAGRNIRSVWEIATQPYPEAHFATYPEALVERCLKAGCPEQVCRTCGKPRERIVENKRRYIVSEGGSHADGTYRVKYSDEPHEVEFANREGASEFYQRMNKQRWHNDPQTLGFTDCGHDDYRPGVVLDPFLGSGTTALVARRLGRHAVGIELNPSYAEMAAKRLSQLSLLAEPIQPEPTLAPHKGLTGGAYSPPGQSPHSNARG